MSAEFPSKYEIEGLLFERGGELYVADPISRPDSAELKALLEDRLLELAEYETAMPGADETWDDDLARAFVRGYEKILIELLLKKPAVTFKESLEKMRSQFTPRVLTEKDILAACVKLFLDTKDMLKEYQK